nr:MAG: ORF1 [Torque teno midi virus]
MPFWWNRRRKPWFGRWRKYRRKTYKRRRYTTRRRRRPATRRRRRRYRKRRKVRRKLQKIPIKQWQPDSIVKCKIKGYGCICAGAEGRQAYCYTNEKPLYPQPKAPHGGGFGAEMFTLEYLYKEWVARRNIWTKSNDYKDLVRYTGTTFIFTRHPTTDFVVAYSRQPPFLLEKEYYNEIHPSNLLLRKHKRLIPSLKRKPGGKLTVKMKIRPPKQMITKWFFQQDFATHGLFTLEAAACNLGWALYGPNSQSRLITFRSLNTNFYQITNWAQLRGSHSKPLPYIPYTSYPTTDTVSYKYPTTGSQMGTATVDIKDYWASVNYSTGFFQPKVLAATQVLYNATPQHEIPITLARYNPDVDTGEGNAVWLESVISETHWEMPHDPDLVIVGKPLWMAFYGFYNYIKKVKRDTAWLESSMFVCKSPAIQLITKTTQTVFPILDNSFTNGTMPYNETMSETQKKLWFPTVEHQLQVINNFVESGPFIPKYSYLKESTWELDYRYISYFKWGGPHTNDQLVQNPQKQGKYDVPDTITEAVQVKDPLKETYEGMLRAWDYRRGIVTTTALKRISKHLQTDSTLYPSEGETPKKKKKFTAEIPHQPEETQEIQACLHSLFEESTCQDPQDLQQLIQHQQQQQQKLKINLLKLMLNLKNKQRILQLQSGID